ncbi:hypothetical protein M569_08828 [Genlisea aurea]|uniref:Isochorismatase-like domain-containing protein n=1 Tax=Genlisea aurea TaxID=192259 RepID=S8DS57_9LAMI|nr:hypothetical protein M569_08828 [Genlisea aurea]
MAAYKKFQTRTEDRHLPSILGTDLLHAPPPHLDRSLPHTLRMVEWRPDPRRNAGIGTHIPDLLRTDSDPVVLKDTYSAFEGTDLEVMVTGVMTNLCCETTARDAFVRGFRVFFSTDSTATASSELHEATLKNMASMASPISSIGKNLRKHFLSRKKKVVRRFFLVHPSALLPEEDYHKNRSR